MATNPFDQFDEPATPSKVNSSANPFDQFDEPSETNLDRAKKLAREELDIGYEMSKDSPYDFSGERTLGGTATEIAKAFPREAAAGALQSIEGLKEYSQYLPAAQVATTAVEKGLGFLGFEPGKEGEDSPFRKARDYLREDSFLRGDDKYQDVWTVKLGGGAGSTMPFLLSRYFLGPIGLRATAFGSGAGEQADRIKQAREAGVDVSELEEFGGLTLGGAIGLSETYLPERLVKTLKSVPKSIPIGEKNRILSMVKRGLSATPEIIKTGGKEGAQEVFSSISQTLVEMGYNPDAELPSGQSLWDDFSVGFVVGAGADAIANGVAARRVNAVSDIDLEREREARQAEEANNFMLGQQLRDQAEQRAMMEADPQAFERQALAARQGASQVAMPSLEEVSRYVAPSVTSKDPTPASTGELYAMRIIGSLRNYFPSQATFAVEQDGDGFRVVDESGIQYGQRMGDKRVASSVASNLNKEISNKGIRGSILDTLMTSPDSYSPQDADALFRYGFRTLSPEANRVSFGALNEAAGTTTEKGYVEDLPLDLLAGAKKLRDGRYSIQMPDGSTQYIAGLTASQKLNLERTQKGLPPATTFDIKEARQFLNGNLGALAQPAISGIQDNAEYGGTLDEDGKPVVMSSAGEVLTGRIVTEAEKLRAGQDEDGNDILPDYIEFKTLDEAKRYAGRLNQRGQGSRFLPAEVLRGKKDLKPDIKRLLEAKNIISEPDSEEVGQLVKSFTGADSFADMSLDDQKLFYARVRELPALSKPSKIPVFKPRSMTTEELGRREIEQKQEKRLREEERDIDEAYPVKLDLIKDIARLGIPLEMFNVKTRITDREGNDITDQTEGYFDPALNELVVAIDSIDPEGKLTQEERVYKLRDVLTHETIHALRSMDLFTQKEWALLESAVARTKRQPPADEKDKRDETYLQRARRMYPDESPMVQVEEAIAELARDYIGNRKLIGGKPKNMLERIIRFFTKLRNFVEGKGFNSFRDVLRAVEAGRVGRRKPGEVRSLRTTEARQFDLYGAVPARYAPFIDEFEGAPIVAPPSPLPTFVQPQATQGAGPTTDFDLAALEGADVRYSRKELPDTIEVDGVQRPTVNSNGQQIHNSEQEVENFWRWATEDGNKPVTDEDGRPVVLYTGTSKDLDFKKFRIPKNGAWFTTDSEEASQYAMQNDSMTSKHDPESGWGRFARFVDVNTASRVMPVYLRAKNPTIIPEEGIQKLSDPRYAYKTAQKDYFERLKFAGSDMAVFPSGKVYVVLGNDLQIKSAIGNIGTYRTDTGDIRYSRKDIQGEPRVPFEVAPSPDNKARAEAWNSMPKAEKVAITRKIGPMAIREVAGIFDIPMSAFKQPILGQGLFEGVVNPNQILGIKANKVKPEQAVQFATALGYVLEQKAMVVADGRMTDKQASVVRIYTKGDATTVADRLYAIIQDEVGDFGGYTAFNDHIDIVNFSSIKSEELARRFTDLINEKASDVDVRVASGTIQSAYIEENKYASSLYRGRPENRRGLERRLDSARGRIIKRLESEIARATGQPSAASGAGAIPVAGGVRGSSGVLQQPSRPYQKNGRAGKSLEGLPKQVKVDGRIIEFDAFRPAQKVAERYMRNAGLPYNPPTKYVRVDPAVSARIADEFDRMQHEPENPLVLAAYRQMMAETAAQYREIMKTGLKVEFIKGDDPYGNPRNAILDIIQNNHFWVFSTKDGFGSNEEMDISDNPLLEETEFKDANGETMLANDLFRVVHDYFGHALPGVGFRADGEENAWRAHAAMYSPLARRAMTSETRGQNSWVNYGPNGEFNRKASPADTIYADQKVGLLPEWVSTDTYETGAALPEPERATPVQANPEALSAAVEAAQKDTEQTGRYAVPLYGPEASPEALYVAQNPEQGSKLSDGEKRRYSRQNTPQFGQKAKDIMDRVTPEMPDETIGETILKKMDLPPVRDMFDIFRKNFVNRYARLERQYRENPELKALLADVSSMAMTEMADHARQFTQRALVYGVPVYEKGMVKVKDFVHKGKKYRGLIEVMAMLHTKEHGNLEQLAHAYATAVRGERLNKEGKLSPVKPGELKILEEEVNKFVNPATGQPIIKEWFETWQAYNSNIVKFLKDTGVIDDAGAELWMKQSDYIPFYRENAEGNLEFPRVFGGLHTAGQFKAVGKSDKALNVDMITAITGNIDAAIAMGMKNVAQQRIIRDQMKLGLASLLKPGEAVGNRNSVSFKVGGKRYTAIIDDPLIYESMLPVSEIQLDGLFGNFLRIPASWLRELIIREPGYMVANMFRDTLSSYVITGAQITPLVDTAKNMFADLTDLENIGVVGGYDLRIDRDSVKKFYEKNSKLMGMKGGINWTNPIMAAWDGLGRLSTRSEAATRLAVYNDVLARTGNEAEAQYQALSVMNYGRRGGNPLFRALTAIVPFMNARVQGLDKLWQATFGRIGAKYETDAQGNVTRNLSNFKNFQRYFIRAGYIVGMSALYYALMHDDDEYKNATPEVRDNYYIIPIQKGNVAAGEPGLAVRLPIPFEVGVLFKVMPERFLAATFGEDTPRDMQESFWRNLKSTLAMNPIPQTFLPFVEVGFNKDTYTGRPIVPTYMENLLPEQQTTFYTNKFVEDIANVMGFSPMKLDHLAQGYGGSLGAYLLQAVDSAWRLRSGREKKPALAWYQYPVVKRFFATANQPGLQSQFYDLKDYMDGITKTINDLEERGQYDELATFYAKNGHIYEMRSTVNYMNRYIARLRDQRKMVEQMDIDPESKREMIEQINMQIAASLTTVPMLRQQAFGPREEE